LFCFYLKETPLLPPPPPVSTGMSYDVLPPPPPLGASSSSSTVTAASNVPTASVTKDAPPPVAVSASPQVGIPNEVMRNMSKVILLKVKFICFFSFVKKSRLKAFVLKFQKIF
jgi:hypothetical protein